MSGTDPGSVSAVTTLTDMAGTEFAERSVWVTGPDGYLGRSICDFLTRRGATVSGVGRSNGDHCLALEHFVNADVNREAIDALYRLTGSPDIIFHLAGGSSVSQSFITQFHDHEDSVGSTAHLCDWVSCHSRDTVVILSSSAAVYGSSYVRPVKESDLCKPISPYGWHKLNAENIGMSYAQSSDLKFLPVRIFSIFGPALRKQIFWDIANLLNNKTKEIHLRGTGEEKRDWIYIDDVVRILAQLALSDVGFGQPVNLGTGCGATVKDVAERFIRAIDPESTLQFSKSVSEGYPNCLVADIDRLLSFEIDPPAPPIENIEKAAFWYRRHVCQM